MESTTRNVEGRLGIFVPIDHEAVLRPHPNHYIYQQMKARIDLDSKIIHACIARLAKHMAHPFFATVPDDEVSDKDPYWRNSFFSGADARALFAFIAEFKPGKYIEIGSGNSTRFARKAVELESPSTRITSIDPVPRASVRDIAHEVIEKSLLEVEPAFFDGLRKNDILFHDGSHIAFNGTDTVHLFMDILPRLAAGVIVHIHDICLPREYLASFDYRGYNEQYLLGAMLLGGEQWEVLLPISYAASEQWLTQSGVSFWMRKKSAMKRRKEPARAE